MKFRPLVRVDGLTVLAGIRGAPPILPIDSVSMGIDRGEIVGLIGESGSGKTTLARSLIGLLARNCHVVEGSVEFNGKVVLTPDRDEMRSVRGRHIGAVFQNATSSLNPVMRIGDQITEVLRVHDRNLSRVEASERIFDLISMLGFLDPKGVLDAFPHQLSGGMRQRAAIAIAAITRPELMIADECTTALDVTTQAEVVDLLRGFVRTSGTALLFVTHDLMLAADLCDRLLVMYGGQIIEAGSTRRVINEPRHPYTRALLQAVPSWGPRGELVGIQGRPPRVNPGDIGCRFAPRCRFSVNACTEHDVPWFDEGTRGHRCLRVAEGAIEVVGAPRSSTRRPT